MARTLFVAVFLSLYIIVVGIPLLLWTVISRNPAALYWGGVKGVTSTADVEAGKTVVIAPEGFLEAIVRRLLILLHFLKRIFERNFRGLGFLREQDLAGSFVHSEHGPAARALYAERGLFLVHMWTVYYRSCGLNFIS